MRLNNKHNVPGALVLVGDVVFVILQGLVYAVSLAPCCYLLWQLRTLPMPLLFLAALVAWPLTALCFVIVIVSLKRVILPGEFPPGRYFLTSPRLTRWLFATRLVVIFDDSPFRSIVLNHSFLRYLYFRGMGAKIGLTFYTAPRALIPEPWGIRAGLQVCIGGGAVVSCHKVEASVLTTSPVELEDNVTIGARAIIHAGVKIGKAAVVGANSVVFPGTVIPPGEIWAGNPARCIMRRPMPNGAPVEGLLPPSGAGVHHAGAAADGANASLGPTGGAG